MGFSILITFVCRHIMISNNLKGDENSKSVIKRFSSFFSVVLLKILHLYFVNFHRKNSSNIGNCLSYITG